MKKFISIIFFIFIASGAFAQFGGYNYLQVYNTLRLKNRFITSVNNDTSFIQNDSFSIPTSWAVYKYFQNKLDSLALSGGQVNSDWNATSGVQQILNKPSIYTKAQVDSANNVQTLDYILGKGNISSTPIWLNGGSWTDGLWVDNTQLVTVNGFISENNPTNMWIDGNNLMFYHQINGGRYYEWDTIKNIRPFNLSEETNPSTTIYFPLGSGTLVTKVNGVPADSTGNVPLPFSNTLDQVLINGNSTNHNIVQTNGAYISQSDLSGWGASLQPGSWDLGTPDGKNLVGLSNQLRWDDSTYGGNSLSLQRLKISNRHDTIWLPDIAKAILAVSVNGIPPDSAGNIPISVGTVGSVTATDTWGMSTVTTSPTGPSVTITIDPDSNQITTRHRTDSIATAKVDRTTTVNGHALSSNVIVSASDITTGTLPHAQLPALVSGDIPNNAANTTGTAVGFTGSLAGDVNGGQNTTSVTKLSSLAAGGSTDSLVVWNATTKNIGYKSGSTYMKTGIDSLSVKLLKKDANKIDTSLLPSISLDSAVIKWSGNTALFRPANAYYDSTKEIKYDSASGNFSVGAINGYKIKANQSYFTRAYKLLGGTIVAEPLAGNMTMLTSHNNLADGTAYYMMVYLPQDTTITGVKWFQNTAGVYTWANANWNGLALYILNTSTGGLTLIDSTGANDTLMWKAPPGIASKAFTTTHNLTAGVYVIGEYYSATTNTTSPNLQCLATPSINGVITADLSHNIKFNATQSGINYPSAITNYSGTSPQVNTFYFALY